MPGEFPFDFVLCQTAEQQFHRFYRRQKENGLKDVNTQHPHATEFIGGAAEFVLTRQTLIIDGRQRPRLYYIGERRSM